MIKTRFTLLALLITGIITATIIIANFPTTENKVDIVEIKENYAFIVREFNEGVSIDEIKKIRQKFLNKVKSNQSVMSSVDPVIPEGAKIVAYGIKIDNNGVIKEYFGFARDKESAEVIYKKAEEWYKLNILTSSKNMGSKQFSI